MIAVSLVSICLVIFLVIATLNFDPRSPSLNLICIKTPCSIPNGRRTGWSFFSLRLFLHILSISINPSISWRCKNKKHSDNADTSMSVTFGFAVWLWPFVKDKKADVIRCHLLYCTLVPGMMSILVYCFARFCLFDLHL